LQQTAIIIHKPGP